MLDMSKGARSDEKFHLQVGMPTPHTFRIPYVVRIVRWSNLFLKDGTPGRFYSVRLFGNAIFWYRGTTKCDGTRTRLYWRLQLDNGITPWYEIDPNAYIMTTTPKEMTALRFFVQPAVPAWDVMGAA